MLSHFDIWLLNRAMLNICTLEIISLTKLCVVALIKEYFSADLLDYNIP